MNIKWHQKLWVGLLSTLTIVGVIVAILSDGAQVFDRIAGKSSPETNKDTLNNEAINELSPANISISLFALNSQICHFNSNKLKGNIMQVFSTLPDEAELDDYTKVIMNVSKGDTSYYPDVANIDPEYLQGTNISNIDTIKVDDNNRLPIFDVTLSNDGDEKTILTQIRVHVYSFQMPEGDGIDGGGKSYAIQSVNRYKIILPELYFFFKSPEEEDGYLNKEFTRDYPALPPILIAPRDAARFQIQLGNSETGGAEYLLSFEFLFSNKQSILSDRIAITF